MNRERRMQMCDQWLGKVRAAKAVYEAAKIAAGHKSLDYASMPISDAALDNRQALAAETRALTEYRRVLVLHHRLVVHGEIPDAA